MSVAVLASGLAFTACQDEDVVEYTAFEVGEEIRFCASAAQDGSATTRTVYGETGTIGGVEYIALNWEVGDKMEIVSPQAALSGGTGKAVYAIDDPNISEGFNGETKGHSNASMLKKEGESGLQWGVGYTKDVDGSGAIDAKLEEGWHDFYALYPSSNSFTSGAEGQIALDLIQVNDEVRPTATGYMPIVQKPDVKKGDGDGISEDVSADGKTTYTIHPDMRYAYMVATTQTSRYKEVDKEDPPIQLEFKPVTTALQFEITANKISSTNGSELTITSIQLTTAPNVTKNICGYFTCDYLSGQMYAQNDNETYNRIYLDISNAKEPITLKQGDKCDVTFFVLPTQDFDAGELQLQIFFTLKGSPQVRSATINRPLHKMKKYHFKNLLMPEFETKVSGSSWWQALDPNTLVSQVSIPVASNVFASSAYIDLESDDTHANSLHQSTYFTNLWNLGVRGFELATQRVIANNNVEDNTSSLGKAPFVADERILASDNYTFNTAFDSLAWNLSQNKNETLVLICTYQAADDGYRPQHYVQQLINYLEEFTKNKRHGFEKANFVQINSGTTVGDLQGNIAIIIRPGDDDRYETKNYTHEIGLGDWADNITLIQDWGTAFDVWDRRYKDVARESTFETLYMITKSKKLTTATARTQIEDWLWGVSSSSKDPYSNVSGQHNFNSGSNWPEKKQTFDFEHAITNSSGGTAYVQEWARVSKGIENIYTGISKGGNGGAFGLGGSTHYLWVNWPESYSEKQKAIDDLFKLSVAEKGKVSENLFINSLSGYYISTSAKEGLYPFKENFKSGDAIAGRDILFDVSGQGKGGDHQGLAYDLNKYVYSILSGDSVMSSTKDKLAEGPWGLVMMEHIGNKTKADDKSVDLVNLIMMNNFKFPLMVESDDDNTGGGDTPNPPATTDAAVSFSNEPANAEGAIH